MPASNSQSGVPLLLSNISSQSRAIALLPLPRFRRGRGLG